MKRTGSSSRLPRPLLWALCLGLCLAAGHVAALPPPGARLAQAPGPEPEQTGPVTLDEAVAQVQERTGGRVLSAETLEEEGQQVHRIRVLLEDQRVRDIHVDAETGQWR
ncbi:MAG: PepSY domain-containing protein [Ectothiorhodospira sp.]